MSVFNTIAGYIVVAMLTAIAMVSGRAVCQRVKGKRKKRKRKRLEFMQKVLLALVVLTVAFVSCSYILAFLGKDTVEGLSTSISSWLFSLDGVVIVIYGVQNCVRAFSADKYLNGRLPGSGNAGGVEEEICG